MTAPWRGGRRRVPVRRRQPLRIVPPPPATLVTGPPGSGKTTLVREHATPRDITIDLDDLWSALTQCVDHDRPAELLPVICRARNAAVAGAAELTKDDVGTVWIISCAATEAKRAAAVAPYFRAGLIVLDVPEQECLRRIEASGRPRPDLWPGLVRSWWREYQPPVYGDQWRRVDFAEDREATQ